MGTAAVAWVAEMRGAGVMETVADAEEVRAEIGGASGRASVLSEWGEVGGVGQ